MLLVVTPLIFLIKTCFNDRATQSTPRNSPGQPCCNDQANAMLPLVLLARTIETTNLSIAFWVNCNNLTVLPNPGIMVDFREIVPAFGRTNYNHWPRYLLSEQANYAAETYSCDTEFRKHIPATNITIGQHISTSSIFGGLIYTKKKCTENLETMCSNTWWYTVFAKNVMARTMIWLIAYKRS